MKKFTFYKLFALLLATVTPACVADDDFELPDISIEEPNLETDPIALGNIVSEFRQAYTAAATDQGVNLNDDDELNSFLDGFQYTFENEQPLYTVGFVISSDEAGNFFEELIVQDNASGPTVGVRVLIDVNPLFTRYEFGRKMYIRLNGLTMAVSNGVITLGVAGVPFVEKIPAPQEEGFLIRSATKTEITPVVLDLSALPGGESALGFEHTNRYVQLNNVQFNRFQAVGDNNQTFAAEPQDEFDGERILESCDNNRSIIFSTSTFADFKAVPLPSGRGSLMGLLTKNFFGDAFNVVVNDPSGITFNSDDRCDPEGINCEDAPVAGTAFLEDAFESYSGTGDVEAAGWVIENSNGGLVEFRLDEFNNNKYMLVSAFNSNEEDIDTWLVSPEFSLNNTAEEELNVAVQTSFDNGLVLSILLSTDYTDSIENA
ncbi:MAG: DUF5689 domain-containing protein, partial [Marinirhabdus sp.]